MSDLQFRWCLYYSWGQRDPSCVINSPEAPAIKRRGEPGWVGFVFDEPHPEAVVMVTPYGVTMTYKKYNALSHRELYRLFYHEGYCYIERYALHPED